MYYYEIDFVDNHDKRCRIVWHCTCNDPKTTYLMAKGACVRLKAKYGVITIRKDNGQFVSLHTFDTVLNFPDVREIKF